MNVYTLNRYSPAARRARQTSCVSIVAVAALLVATPVPGQSITPPDTFQPWHSVMFRSVTSVELSPDGRRSLFLRSDPRRPLADDSDGARVGLYMLDASGREVPFVTGNVTVSEPTWVDDNHIGFLLRREGDRARSFYRIPTGGGEAQKLFEYQTDISSVDLSPDGRWLAFLANDRKSEERRQLESKGFNQEIYEEDHLLTRLYLADLQSGTGPGSRVVRTVPVEGSVRAVRFSPDGQRLLIVSTPTPLVDDSYVAMRLRVLDREGKVLTTINNSGKLDAAAWSPDGRRIAFVSGEDRNDPAPGRLMLVDATGGPIRDLLPKLEGHVTRFDWVDASTLAYVADIGTGTAVGTVPAAGGSAQQVLAAGALIVSAIDVDDSGSAAIIANTATHPDEVFTLQLRGAKPERRTSSNEWLAKLRFADQQSIRFKARDGLELEGILIYPLGYERGRRYPLVLVAHGGPESHYRNGWLTGYATPGQVFAARGFAVFYPNYRGSTGRGVAFSKISQASATGAEFDDLVDGVDHLINIGLVDREKVGITGGSYGGYASAWGATYYSERFAAAIPFVGISNAISKVGTTDIPQEMYDVHHRKWLWDDWDYFAKASPIKYVTRNRTPTLILHGKDDPRVHPSQSLELYRHLKVLGRAPVRLVLYPGEGHGNRRSAARFDYALRTLQWMEHYLKGPGGQPPPTTIEYARYLPWGTSEGSTPAPAVSTATR